MDNKNQSGLFVGGSQPASDDVVNDKQPFTQRLLSSVFGIFNRGNQGKSTNPSFDQFNNVQPQRQDGVLDGYIKSRFESQAGDLTGWASSNAYSQLINSNVAADKIKRLNYFRGMTKFTEINDALEEIADNCINFDDEQKIVKIGFSRSAQLKFSSTQQKEINEIFESFISLYDFEKDGFLYFIDMLRDGEICWENIVDNECPENGIIAIKRIPTECFEYLVDMNFNIIGIIINAMLCTGDDNSVRQGSALVNTSVRQTLGVGGEVMKFNYMPRNNSQEIIVMPISQTTLVNTGDFSPDKQFVYPILERARRAYNQLSLIEDAIIIYRLIRAPQRLVFNVNVGKLPPHKAEEQVLKMMKRYQSKKVYDPQSGSVVNDYDVHQMLENFWFPKDPDGGGTDVETIGGDTNLGELPDLEYFQQKLLRSLKIPIQRFSKDAQDYDKSGAQITYDEYRFGQFIMRIQNRFAAGIKDAFMTHLRLIGLWDKYEMIERDMQVSFTQPTNVELYYKQKIMTIKMENLDTATSSDKLSFEQACRETLGWTDEQIQKNRINRLSEELFEAEIEWRKGQISQNGPVGVQKKQFDKEQKMARAQF